MAKLFGVHKVELKPGVTEEEFEKFMKEFHSSMSQVVSGWKNYLLKGIRGDRDGKYLILIEVESVEERDRWFTTNDEPSEEAKRFMEDHPEFAKLFERRDSLISNFDENYTDYVELD